MRVAAAGLPVGEDLPEQLHGVLVDPQLPEDGQAETGYLDRVGLENAKLLQGLRRQVELSTKLRSM